MYFIQHLLLNLKLIQQISQILSYITFITKFNCTFKNTVNTKVPLIAIEAADPRGSAVELANHRAVREYRRKISSQRKGPFFDHIWV